MHARVTTVPIQRDKISDATSIYQNDILPIISGTPGCQGVYLLVDPNTGNAQSITLWDNPANAQSYESSGTYQQLVAKLAQYFAGPPSLATYDVAVHS
jgi:quinol monooxygenase YgiN